MRVIACLSLAGMATSCSMIDEDRSDCPDYSLNYELRLVTNMTTEIKTQLDTQTDVVLAQTLREQLSGIFNDYANDVDLSFYDVTGDSLRLYHDAHIMGGNQRNYSLSIPRQKYMHLAVANVVDNPIVELLESEHCHKSILKRGVIDVNHQDTLDSHTTGIFTAREHMEMLENVNQSFNVHLYMANCAASLVIDPRGQSTDGIEVFSTGFATAFNIADSTYTYSDTPHIIRTTPIEAGGQLGFCSVTFPSPDPKATRSVIETTEPFVSAPSANQLWQFKVYVRRTDGSTTESILGINEPLRAGQLKIIKCWMGENGAIATDDQTVAVSVTLDWHEGGNHEIDL